MRRASTFSLYSNYNDKHAIKLQEMCKTVKTNKLKNWMVIDNFQVFT